MKFYLFSFILESAVVRSEMEVVLQCENYVQVDSLTVVDFAMLYVVTRRLLLSSRVSLLVINLFESFTIQVVRLIEVSHREDSAMTEKLHGPT